MNGTSTFCSVSNINIVGFKSFDSTINMYYIGFL